MKVRIEVRWSITASVELELVPRLALSDEYIAYATRVAKVHFSGEARMVPQALAGRLLSGRQLNDCLTVIRRWQPCRLLGASAHVPSGRSRLLIETDPLNDPNSHHAKRSVYFGFDQ